jgi:hypothetical protein
MQLNFQVTKRLDKVSTLQTLNALSSPSAPSRNVFKSCQNRCSVLANSAVCRNLFCSMVALMDFLKFAMRSSMSSTDLPVASHRKGGGFPISSIVSSSSV